MTDSPGRPVVWWLEEAPPSVVVSRGGSVATDTCPACGRELGPCVIEAVEPLDLATQTRTGLRVAYTVRCQAR